jgi:transposase
MSYRGAEVLGRIERRRRFSVEQKLAVLAEATAPGANLSAIARWHGLLPAQLYKWRRLAELGVIGVPGASELPSKPAEINDAPRRRRRKKAELIEIELAGGRRVRVDRDVDAAALERVLDVLARR